MSFERCDKAAMGMECLRIKNHLGQCQCVKSELFNASLEDAEQWFLEGTAGPQPKGLFAGTSDPADELGKVWDVLHAAGINGAGGMSASEGVKELMARHTAEVSDKSKPTKPCQHDWLYVKAMNKMCCTQCEATRSAV